MHPEILTARAIQHLILAMAAEIKKDQSEMKKDQSEMKRLADCLCRLIEEYEKCCQAAHLKSEINGR